MTYWPLLAAASGCALAVYAAVRVFKNIRSDLLAAVTVAAGVICAFAALVLGALFLDASYSRVSCRELGERTGTITQYRLITGCHIEVGDRFIPYGRWAQVTGANAP